MLAAFTGEHGRMLDASVASSPPYRGMKMTISATCQHCHGHAFSGDGKCRGCGHYIWGNPAPGTEYPNPLAQYQPALEFHAPKEPPKLDAARMTLRQYYAGLAMAAMIPTIRTEKDARRFIAGSVQAADALIAELEKTNETL